MSDSTIPPRLSTSGYRVLWAKSNPPHPLWKHLLDSAAVSLALRNPLDASGWSEKQTAMVVGLHDMGKADAAFQCQDHDLFEKVLNAGFPSKGDGRCRHERLSAQFVRESLRKCRMSERDADTVGRGILAHHGYWTESWREVPGPYKKAQDQLLELLKAALDLDRLPDRVVGDHSAFGMRLAGHVVLCDWIASNEKFFGDAKLAGVNSPEGYFAAARDVAREWVGRLGLARERQLGNPSCIVGNARPIQQMLLERDIPPGLVIIEAPMGEGKTEAAWILAEKWRSSGYQGIYMALPTMATSDSLYRRYHDDYLEKLGTGEDAKLVHGMAWLRDEDKKEPEKPVQVGEPGDDSSLADAWFRSTRRAMLAAHGVGTVDQAMLAGMNVKFGFLRLYGLADRVLVIDEVHAYDAYMSAIVGRLLQWCACLKTPVILLSATLSARQRATMIQGYGATGGDSGANAPYPLITVADAGKEAWAIEAKASSSRTLKIEKHHGWLGDAKRTAGKAAELVKNGGCCCVILNTVKQAQAVYQALKLDGGEKLLFHARFTAEDRRRISDEVLDKFGKGRWVGEGGDREFRPGQRPEKSVLVATQVVEQSLDADFDYMITEITPMDLLLQRSGRIKRHPRDRNGRPVDGPDQRGEPTLHVLLPDGKDKKSGAEKPKFGPSEVIYQRYPLLRTLEAIKGRRRPVRLPEDFRPLIEAVYSDDLPADASTDLREAKQVWDDLQEDLSAQAGEFLLCEPMADEFDPVGADEVGDDSDDGNGWRARTRLGLEDVLVIPVETGELPDLIGKEVVADKVRELYQRSVRIPPHPPYHWPPRPENGYDRPVLGEKRLRGVWLLPVKKNADGWQWEGLGKNKKPFTIKYDPKIGLTHGGDK